MKLLHLHTYARKKGNKLIYRCIHPDCTHYVNRELLKGKRARCKCGQEFIISDTINGKHLKRAELKCDTCLGLEKIVLPKEIMNEIFHPPQLPSTVLELETPELDETDLILEEDD